VLTHAVVGLAQWFFTVPQKERQSVFFYSSNTQTTTTTLTNDITQTRDPQVSIFKNGSPRGWKDLRTTGLEGKFEFFKHLHAKQLWQSMPDNIDLQVIWLSQEKNFESTELRIILVSARLSSVKRTKVGANASCKQQELN